MIGRIYCAAVVVGTIGALMLIVRTTSGPAAASGFLILAVIWFASMCRAVWYIAVCKPPNVVQHRRWMMRNYFYTYAAVPFRFLPAIVHLLSGVPMTEPNPWAYPVGAYLSVILMVAVCELYLRSDQEDPDGGGAITELGENPIIKKGTPPSHA